MIALLAAVSFLQSAQGCCFAAGSPPANLGFIIDAKDIPSIFAVGFENDVRSIRGLFGLDAPLAVVSGPFQSAMAIAPSTSLQETPGGLIITYDSLGNFDIPNVAKGADGFVAFSNALLITFYQTSQSYGIPVVVAHELAHLLQFKKGLSTDTPVVKKELDADFMAGYAMAIRDMWIPGNDSQMMAAVFTAGSDDFTDPQWHGTGADRLNAFLAGAAVSSLSVSDAYQKGLQYLNIDGPGAESLSSRFCWLSGL